MCQSNTVRLIYHHNTKDQNLRFVIYQQQKIEKIAKLIFFNKPMLKKNLLTIAPVQRKSSVEKKHSYTTMIN